MGDGVSGSTNAPVNQTTNIANSGAASRANANAQAQFGQALEQERATCPPGLGRPTHGGSFPGSFPSRYEPPCSYLRPPGQEPPKPDKPVGIPRYTGDDVPQSPIKTKPPADDYKQPTPKLEKKDPELPPLKHGEGLATDQGGHIISVEGKHDKLK
jgi:hypothetical protein